MIQELKTRIVRNLDQKNSRKGKKHSGNYKQDSRNTKQE